MIAVLQKVKADIFSRPLISLLIVVTVAAASTLLTLALATLMNLSAPYDRAFEELNAAHVWLYFDRDRLRSRDIMRIESLPGVAQSTGLQFSIVTQIEIRDARVWTSLRVMPQEMPSVNRLLINQGQYLHAQEMEILIAQDLADLYDLSIGDLISVTRWDGKEIELPIVGIAYNPMWDTYRNTQPPYLYLTEDTLRVLFPDQLTWDQSIGLRLKDPQAIDELIKQVKDILRSDTLITHTDWRDVKESAIFGAQINFAFLGTFSFFATLATILVVTTSINSTVLSQFRQIGVLKSIGFSQSQILALYIGQYLALTIIGSPLGLFLGIALAPLPLKSVAASLNTPFKPPLNLPLIALVLGIVHGVTILATTNTARKGARTNIVEALAVGAEAPHKQTTLSTHWITQLGVPIPLYLGLNEIFAKPLRSLLTDLNLILGVMGIIFGLTLNETLEMYNQDPSLLGIVYDAIVTRERTGESKVEYILRSAPGVHSFYSEYLTEVKTEQGKSFQIRAIAGDLETFPFRISQGRFFQPGTYEAIAGRGLLDWLGLSIGDTLTLVVDAKRHHSATWQIVGQYPEPVNAGQMLMVDWATVAPILKPAAPQTYYLNLDPNADTVQLREYLESHTNADLNFTLIKEALPDAIVYLQLAIFVLAGILIIIALINVFNTSLLAAQEKSRMIGILKTIGLAPVQVILMINATAGFLGIIATIVGIPLGFVFTKVMLALLSNMYGFGQAHVTLNPLHALLLLPTIIILSMIGSMIPGWRASRLSIVSVLHNE